MIHTVISVQYHYCIQSWIGDHLLTLFINWQTRSVSTNNKNPKDSTALVTANLHHIVRIKKRAQSASNGPGAGRPHPTPTPSATAPRPSVCAWGQAGLPLVSPRWSDYALHTWRLPRPRFFAAKLDCSWPAARLRSVPDIKRRVVWHLCRSRAVLCGRRGDVISTR